MANLQGMGGMATEVTRVYQFGALESRLRRCHDRNAMFEDPEFAGDLAQRLDEMLGDAGTAPVLSLDVFDTLLLRDDSSELTRFFEIGKEMAAVASSRLSLTITQQDAFLARHMGTKATYRCRDRIKGFGEGSLTEIHQTSSRILCGTSDLAEDFIAAELDYERQRTTANQALVVYMREMRSRGGRVALITDMYMHANHVESLLSAHGISPGSYDYLVSSADQIVSKASGKLFAVVEKALSAKPGEFVHVGDSLKGDMQRPLEQGWQALHLPISTGGVQRRRADHLQTASHLRESFGLNVDIAMPK